MSEEKQKSGLFDSLGTIKKFHPVAFVLILALMYVFITVLNLEPERKRLRLFDGRKKARFWRVSSNFE